jgi:PIN domain nuclease of toxin-antitoxin system
LSHVLLDTHVWAWSMMDDALSSIAAEQAIRSAGTVAVSVISLYEIGQKARLGKWPQMATRVSSLVAIAEQQGIKLLPVSAEISLTASQMDWLHRDPFDRIIAATAMAESRTLLSADKMFDALVGQVNWPGCVW